MENKDTHITNVANTTVVDYVQQKLTNTEQHQIEAAMQNDPFLNDAIEGLHMIESKGTIESTIAQLNHQLLQNLQASKKKKRRKMWFQLNNIAAAVAVAVVAILCYCVYYFVWLKK
jgi:cytochrome c-type biogenesis protein CcmH/NrfG